LLEAETGWGVIVVFALPGLLNSTLVEHERLKLHLSIAELAERRFSEAGIGGCCIPTGVRLSGIEHEGRDVQLFASNTLGLSLFTGCASTSRFRH
jgi:hypothetical protein